MTTTYDDNATPDRFTVGQRVELHPAMDLWMRGARYGEVARIGRRYVHIAIGGGIVQVAPRNLRVVS